MNCYVQELSAIEPTVSQTLLQYVNSQLTDTWTAEFKIEKTFYAVCATYVHSNWDAAPCTLVHTD
jgi:hypothetical protein